MHWCDEYTNNYEADYEDDVENRRAWMNDQIK